MGLLIFPVFNPELPTIPAQTSGECLGAEFPLLDAVAAEHGLSGLSRFGDTREIPEDFDGPPWEIEEILGPCEDWHDASEGQAAMTALGSLLRDNAVAAERFEAPDALIVELDDLARILGTAHAAGAKFRLEVS